MSFDWFETGYGGASVLEAQVATNAGQLSSSTNTIGGVATLLLGRYGATLPCGGVS